MLPGEADQVKELIAGEGLWHDVGDTEGIIDAEGLGNSQADAVGDPIGDGQAFAAFAAVTYCLRFSMMLMNPGMKCSA
jgi:hypothetical protein